MTLPRYLIAGAANTGLTYLAYLGLLIVVPYIWAYSLSYALGIVVGYLFNARWVFGGKVMLRTAAFYPLTYVLNYLIGACLLWVFVEFARIPMEIAPLCVVALSVPLMYIVTRGLFQGIASHEKAVDQ
jgi:putative flippase GtrA